MTAVTSLEMLEKARQGPPFHSKKNRVFKSSWEGKPCVVKVYRGEWRERASNEYDILRGCTERMVSVPAPIALLEGAIVMSPVDGQTAGDLFDRLIAVPTNLSITSELERLADLLARWLTCFHSAFDFKLARGDSILRNFIVLEGGVVGLDFEESTRSDTVDDLGQLCASALMTDPPFTEKKLAFARHLADRYWTCSGQRREADLPGTVSRAVRYYSQFRSNGPQLQSLASRVERGEVKI